MAQLYSTGPVGIWIGYGSQAVPLFLGHGERAPRINIRPFYREVNCDLGGEAPFDSMYSGEIASVSVNLVRYNETVLAHVQSRAGTGQAIVAGGAGARGTNNPGEIGSLMVTEGIAYRLWLRFPHNAKTAYNNAANGVMPAGYRFFAAFVAGPDDIVVGTTDPKKIQINFTCLRTFLATYTNGAGGGQFALYDHNMDNLTPID